MHYFPLAWPFFVALVALLGLLLVLLELGVLEYAYGRLGVERKYMLLLLVGSLLAATSTSRRSCCPPVACTPREW